MPEDEANEAANSAPSSDDPALLEDLNRYDNPEVFGNPALPQYYRFQKTSNEKCDGVKHGTGNCIHFHTTCPNIESIRASVTVNLVASVCETAISRIARCQPEAMTSLDVEVRS